MVLIWCMRRGNCIHTAFCEVELGLYNKDEFNRQTLSVSVFDDSIRLDTTECSVSAILENP